MEVVEVKRFCRTRIIKKGKHNTLGTILKQAISTLSFNFQRPKNNVILQDYRHFKCG